MADITITAGDTLEVDYNLENTGDDTGTFDPRLLVQGVQEDQDTGITLDPTQTATGTLQWPTQSGDAVTDAPAEALTDDTSDSITVTVESAIPDSVVDDFEQNRLSNYSGDTGQVSIVTGTVVEGTQSLRISDGAFGDGIGSTSGLPNYPQQGDRIQCWVYLTETNQNANFIYYTQQATDFPSNFYGTKIDAANGKFTITKDGSGNIASTSFNASNYLNEWLKIIGKWDTNNVHSFEVRDTNNNVLVSVQGSNNKYDSVSDSGIVLRNGNNADNSAPMYFDGVFTS